MYTRQEASLIRQKFWTSFGQYMRPVKGAEGEAVNWLNYKTGVKNFFIKMDADTSVARIAIELRHPDGALQQQYFEQLQHWRTLLEQISGGTWHWQLLVPDEHGQLVSRIERTLDGVNIFSENDWPAIISFLKPAIISLDEFWTGVKDSF